MEINTTAPALEQIMNYTKWDAAVGIPVAIFVALVIGAYLFVTVLFSGYRGTHPDNLGWVMANTIGGFVLSLVVLAESGSWLAGVGTAVVSFIVLRTIRIAFQYTS